MAQLRDDCQKFVERNTVVIAVGPDDEKAFADYWRKEQIPFIGLADPKHIVADRYGQKVKFLKLGRLPAVFVIDKEGKIRYEHYGDSASDIPPNEEIIAILDEINRGL